MISPLFGQSCRMEEILEIANKNNLQVIEDNAQALGSKYKFSNSQKQMSGTIGDIATTSFLSYKKSWLLWRWRGNSHKLR